jgi:HK97 family phage prohead protease
MPVDVTDKYIRIRVRDPGDFVDDSFRTVVLSEDQGISAVMGKLKTDPNGSMVIQSYLFLKEKGWTADKAQKWVADHKEKKSEEPFMYIKPDEMERRCLPVGEIRLNEVEQSPKIIGYAAVFNTWTDIGGWFKEMIRPGAFTKTIKENDIRALKNHDENLILGRNKAKPKPTLRLWEDTKGLAVEIDPPDTTYSNDLRASIKRGDVNQMSFGFHVNKADMDYEKSERVLIDITLFDVSVVTFPAYPTTSAQVRSLFQRKEDSLPESPKWADLDAIMVKIKEGIILSEEELRALTTYVPGLSLPACKPQGDSDGTGLQTIPAQKPGRDKWAELYIKAEMQIPTIYAFKEDKKR